MEGILPKNPSWAHKSIKRNNAVPLSTVYQSIFTDFFIVEFLPLVLREAEVRVESTELNLSYKVTKVRKVNST